MRKNEKFLYFGQVYWTFCEIICWNLYYTQISQNLFKEPHGEKTGEGGSQKEIITMIKDMKVGKWKLQEVGDEWDSERNRIHSMKRLLRKVNLSGIMDNGSHSV